MIGINQQEFQVELARFNQQRVIPQDIGCNWAEQLQQDMRHLLAEGSFVETCREQIVPLMADMPSEPEAFMRWFEQLRQTGPGQGDALFPWLAQHASMEQMLWFLTQEAAGEAGFDDLVAMTQVKLPPQAKLEMARNYWDEMGRGHECAMHGVMLTHVVSDLNLQPKTEETVWESLALANLMLAMAINRRYAYHSVGALGVIEMTAPTRVGHVNDGLKRLNVPINARKYFQLHATLDIKHSEEWNREVIYPLVKSDMALAKPIAEGALMRLSAGARCFERYRQQFNLSANLH